MGNLVADALRDFTQADIAMDSTRFIYGELHYGALHPVDFFNANGAIYNQALQRSWNVRTLPMNGKALKWLLYLLYGTQKLSSFGLISFSGISFVYDPLFFLQQQQGNLMNALFQQSRSSQIIPQGFPVVKDIQIQGKPLDESRRYWIATGGGILEAFEFINTKIVDMFPLLEVKDFEVENWRVLADYVKKNSPITEEMIGLGTRIRTLQPDLGIFYDDIQWEPIAKSKNGIISRLNVRIKNYGSLPSKPGTSGTAQGGGPRLRLLVNTNGLNTAIDPVFRDLGLYSPIPALDAGQSTTLSWIAELPDLTGQGVYAITARIEGLESEINTTNNDTTHWFFDQKPAH